VPALQKKLLFAIAILLIVQAVVFLVKYFGELSSDGADFGGDFIVFWSTASLLGQGNIGQLYDTGTIDQAIASIDSTKIIRPFIYPPYALFLLWPIRNLGYGDAVALWTLLPLPFYFYILTRLVGRSLPAGHDKASRHMLYVVAAAAMLPALGANIFTGQTAAFIGILFLAAGLCWGRYPFLAGICIGLIAMKPQFGLLFPVALIAAGQWRTFIAAAVTIIVMAIAVTLWLGDSIWPDYLHMTQRFAVFLQLHGDYFKKLGLSAYTSLQALLPYSIALGAQAVVTLVTAVIIIRVFRERDKERNDLRYGMLACGALLATPYTLCYDMPLLAAAMVPLLVRFWHRGVDNMLEIAVFAAFVAAPYAQPLFSQWNVPFGLVTVLLLLTALWRCYVRSSAGASIAAMPVRL
jgi:alpha-1,2-mannosyltransferase